MPCRLLSCSVAGEEGSGSSRQTGGTCARAGQGDQASQGASIGLFVKEERKKENDEVWAGARSLYPAKAAAGPCTRLA